MWLLTILFMHVLDGMSESTAQEHIVVEFRQVGCCRQLGTGDLVQWMERGDVVERLDAFKHQPDDCEAKDDLGSREIGQVPIRQHHFGKLVPRSIAMMRRSSSNSGFPAGPAGI